MLATIKVLFTCAHHFATGKDQRRRPRIANAHDDGGESLWIVLGIARVHGDLFQIQLATVKVNRGDNVL